jgi:hypothetical protein
MCRYYEHVKRFSAMVAAIRLARGFAARLWDGHPAKCRQISGIGKLLGDKLVAAGYGDLRDMLAADARLLERAVHKVYPWGDVKKSEISSMLPPLCSIDVHLEGVHQSCQVTMCSRYNLFALYDITCRRVTGTKMSVLYTVHLHLICLLNPLALGPYHDEPVWTVLQHADTKSCEQLITFHCRLL